MNRAGRREARKSLRRNADEVRFAADGTQVVDVIARVKDPQVNVPGLNVITAVRQIVTGTVSIDDIESVAGHENAIKLERPKRVYADLHDSVPEIRARQADLALAVPAGTDASDGSGVIVGFVDFGCDFLHENFRRADGTTRIVAFWDQTGTATNSTPSPAPYGFGREISAAVINDALDHAGISGAAHRSPNSRIHHG